MPRQLRTDVHLATTPGAIPTRFAKGTRPDDLPAGVADAIRNPAAWVDVEDVVEVIDDVEEVEVVDVVEDTDEQDDEPAAAPGTVVEPPRGGRGATDEAWRSFAAALGQPVDEHATRSDVIAQLSGLGLIDAEG